MSNRLGRNPLKSPRPAKKTPKETIPSASEFVQECLSETPEQELPKTPLERLVHWLYIDLPAESYVFGLKSVLLMKTIWD